MKALDELTRRFAVAGQLMFEELPGGFLVAHVDSDFGKATVALQGAHVMSYQSINDDPLIWLSPQAKFAAGKSIRGGVPICWPWFGQHATDAKFPGHGFARTVPWQLVDARALPDGRSRLEFELIHSEATRGQWHYASTVRNIVTVGQELEIELATTNTDVTTFQLSQALHTYFAVGDIRRVSIAGLDGCEFIDKVSGTSGNRQKGSVVFSAETDRIYLGTRGYCEIKDPAMGRSILVTSTGSRSTVVWNPWIDKADKMGDFGPEGYLGMVCVETANAADDAIVLAPGETHRMIAQFRSIQG
jgi:D-hexose-6-phosphate mutarotase